MNKFRSGNRVKIPTCVYNYDGTVLTRDTSAVETARRMK